MAKRSTGPQTISTGPWAGVRSLDDPYAVPPSYLLDALNGYVPDGKGGSGFYARPGFRRLALLRGSPVTDALVRGRLVWVDSMSAGEAQSIGGGVGQRPYGRYTNINGTFTYSPFGGPDDGGHVVATSSGAYLQVQRLTTEVIAGAAEYAVAARLGTSESDADHRQGSLYVWHNLNGQTIASPTQILNLTHVRVLVNADHTLTVQWHENPNGGIDVWHTIETSTRTVPADGWFLNEYQWAISPLHYDKGGFFAARRCIPGTTGVTGESILRTVGTRTRGEFASVIDHDANLMRICVPQETACGGAGYLTPDGNVPRWLYEIFAGVALPTANGDAVQSDIHYEHHDTYALDASGNPQDVGMDLTWGDAERWKNVKSVDHSATSAVEELRTTAAIGAISASTGKWTSGPTYPTDTVARVTLRGSAMDLYRTTFSKVHAEIVAVGGFVLAGWRTVVGLPGGLGGGFRLPWVFTGPKPTVPNIGPNAGGDVDLDTQVRSANLAYQVMTKLASGDLVEGRGSAAASEWRAMPGVQRSRPGVTEGPWTTDTLPQVGARGDFTMLDAIGGLDPGDRWVDVSLGLAALDVVYRKRSAPTTIIVPLVPVVDLVTASSDLANGDVTIYDASVDFNGTEHELTTGIVTRSINWGDGTAADLLSGSGSTHPQSHSYARHGSYIATLTVTNALGLSASATHTYVVPVATPTALFVVATNEADVSGQTIDFTDQSSNVVGTIVSWAWTFGDGGTSTTQSPSHTFATPATYHVSLEVVDDSGQHATFSDDLAVPIAVGGSDCSLSAGAIADAVNVQGDDFNGGNPPLPAYVNTVAFATIFWDQDTYRGFYDGANPSNNNGTDFSIASDKTFDGHKTLKFTYGPSTMGGWFAAMSNDDASAEAFVGQPGRYGHWSRLIFSGEPGLVGTPFGGAGGGLILLEVDGSNTSAYLVIRDGTVQIDLVSFLANGVANTTTTVDTGLTEATFLQSGFGEAIIWYGADPAAHTMRLVAWAGASCTLGGASAIGDQSRAAFAFSSANDAKIGVRNAQFAFGRMTNASDKAGWVGLAEMQPGALSDNPYGVGLP